MTDKEFVNILTEAGVSEKLSRLDLRYYKNLIKEFDVVHINGNPFYVERKAGSLRLSKLIKV